MFNEELNLSPVPSGDDNQATTTNKKDPPKEVTVASKPKIFTSAPGGLTTKTTLPKINFTKASNKPTKADPAKPFSFSAFNVSGDAEIKGFSGSSSKSDPAKTSTTFSIGGTKTSSGGFGLGTSDPNGSGQIKGVKLNFGGPSSEKKIGGFGLGTSDPNGSGQIKGVKLNFGTPSTGNDNKGKKEEENKKISFTGFGSKTKDENKSSEGVSFFNFSNKSGGESSVFNKKSINFKKEETENPVGEEEFEPEMTVEPIISLPRIENHDDGQTNHTIEFEEVAKVYCWAREQWINHGNANVQISTDNTTNASTLVARDPVTKKLRLCGAVHKDSNIIKKKKKAVSMSHTDYAGDNRDGGNGILFSIRFKTEETRDNFIATYLKAVTDTPTPGATNQAKSKKPEANSAEKIIPSLNFAKPTSSKLGKESNNVDKSKFILKIPKQKTGSQSAAKSDEDTKKLDWVESYQMSGKSLWSSLCDLNSFGDNTWNEGKICRISVCTKDDKFWVEIFDEQVNNQLLHCFAFFSNILIKIKDNAIVWSCLDYANSGVELTICATFKGRIQAEHCQAIFESIKNPSATLAEVNGIITSTKYLDMNTSAADVLSTPAKNEKFSKPVTSDPPASETNKTEEKKPAFGTNKTEEKKPAFGGINLNFGGTGAKKEEKKEKTPFLNFAGFGGFSSNKNDDGKKNSFGDIFKKDGAKFSFGNNNTSFASSSKGHNPFGKNEPKKETPTTTGEPKTNEEDEDNGLEYTLEPLVKLEKIDHKTGEEEDEIIFQKQGKVYIFVSEDHDLKGKAQWKERGQGDIFIKKNKNGKCRVIQRQNITKKLRIHHYCAGEIDEFKTPTRMSWTGIDNCDGLEHTDESGNEVPGSWIFVAKFKSPEDAAEFNEAFKEGVRSNSSADAHN